MQQVSCCIQMFLSYGLMYALSWKLPIIGLLLEYFATFLKILHMKKIARKCSIFLCQLYFCLWESQGDLFGDKDQIPSGRVKGRGKRGLWGEAQNEGYFCKLSIIKQDTNFISQTVGQTNF